MNKFENVTESWPPTNDELKSESRKPPTSVYLFLSELMRQDSKGELSTQASRTVESFACDIVHSVTRGKVLQRKHVLLGLGLHNLTGSRKIVDIINKLGHCIPYNLICEINTAQAESSLEASKESNILPLKPESPEGIVLTHYWVDNFDVIIDRINGGGSVNTTHLVAYQEKQGASRADTNIHVPIPKKKNRKLFIDDFHVHTKPVEKQPNPTSISRVSDFSEASFNSEMKFLLWLYTRKCNNLDQNISSFKGWALKHRSAAHIEKTVGTYLPPITSKVTDYTTIQKYMSYLKNISRSVNMPYINITLDVGAAINAYKTIWSHKEEYKNIIIHLGCFHFLKENFQVQKFLFLF